MFFELETSEQAILLMVLVRFHIIMSKWVVPRSVHEPTILSRWLLLRIVTYSSQNSNCLHLGITEIKLYLRNGKKNGTDGNPML